MELVAVVQVSLESSWYELELPQRQAMRRDLFELFRLNDKVRCRWFDADPWTGTGAEFLVCEFSSLQAYWSFWKELREHSIFRQSYARIERVSLGYERSLAMGLVET